MDRQQATEVVEPLFESWGAHLVRVAYRATKDHSVADDLVQETFMALYRKLKAGTKIENTRAWTLTVIRHLAAKHLRDTRRRGEQFASPGLLEAVAGGVEPAQPEPDYESVTELLSVLTRREEEVVLLRMECMKYREIAAELGINAKSVATLLVRALRKLQAAANRKLAGESIPVQSEADVPKTLQ